MWRKKRDLEKQRELDQRIEQAKDEQNEVAAMRQRTQRLSKKVDRHLAHNHFAERLVEDIVSSRRGKHA